MTKQDWVNALIVFAPDKVRTIRSYDRTESTWLQGADGLWRKIA